MSDKSVFGQCGPKNISYFYGYFLQQTICRKLCGISINNTNSNLIYKMKSVFKIWLTYIQNTKNVSNNFYSFLVKIFVLNNNPQITKARIIFLSKFKIIYFFDLCMLVGISEAIRLLLAFLINIINFIILKSLTYLPNYIIISRIKYSGFSIEISSRSENNENSNSFNEWVAGIIDGDGCFLLSKKGYASLEITIQLRDVRCLNLIKQKFGGSIKVRANQNHIRYRLHNKQGLLKLIYAVNGLIRNPIRMLQLAKICGKYNISFLYPEPLTYNNGWLSGFFDTDGSVYLNLISSQIFITASQKNKLMLDPLVRLYGGTIYLSKGTEHFKWMIYRKNEIIRILDYFELYPPKSAKFARIKLISKYMELRGLGTHKSPENSVFGKAWKQFLIKWDSFDIRK